METIKNKIEELKKEVIEAEQDIDNWGDFEMAMDDAEEYFDAYGKKCKLAGLEEAQKLFDETLKNIIDELKTCSEWDTIDVIRLIKKHSQKSQGGSKTSDTKKNSFPNSFSNLSSNPDTSILDDFCEELKDELLNNSFSMELFDIKQWEKLFNKENYSEINGQWNNIFKTQYFTYVDEKIDKLKQKHGEKR